MMLAINSRSCCLTKSFWLCLISSNRRLDMLSRRLLDGEQFMRDFSFQVHSFLGILCVVVFGIMRVRLVLVEVVRVMIDNRNIKVLLVQIGLQACARLTIVLIMELGRHVMSRNWSGHRHRDWK